MWGNIEIVEFLKHEDWYEQIPNEGYVPTKKTPKDKIYILEKLNEKLIRQKKLSKISIDD